MPSSTRKGSVNVSETVSPPVRSPIALGAAGRTTSPLTLTDLTSLTKITVRASPNGPVRAALGTPFGRATRPPPSASRDIEQGESGISAVAGALVVGSGPGEWLVLAPPADDTTADELRAALTELVDGADEFASVVDLTHGRALVRLRGADCAALLAKVCAVDLADPVIPNGAAFRTSVARVVTDVVRDDVAGVRSYLLHCERSSGQFLADCLLDAGTEFGIDVAAFNAPGI
jgi:heterotetrameric sarcosine oxidase gamma subunit